MVGLAVKIKRGDVVWHIEHVNQVNPLANGLKWLRRTVGRSNELIHLGLDRQFQTVDFFSVNDLAELDERTFRNFAEKR